MHQISPPALRHKHFKALIRFPGTSAKTSAQFKAVKISVRTINTNRHGEVEKPRVSSRMRFWEQTPSSGTPVCDQQTPPVSHCQWELRAQGTSLGFPFWHQCCIQTWTTSLIAVAAYGEQTGRTTSGIPQMAFTDVRMSTVSSSPTNPWARVNFQLKNF